MDRSPYQEKNQLKELEALEFRKLKLVLGLELRAFTLSHSTSPIFL
jgi:hypothetical protein